MDRWIGTYRQTDSRQIDERQRVTERGNRYRKWMIQIDRQIDIMKTVERERAIILDFIVIIFK